MQIGVNMQKLITVALDAMGGDNAPGEIIKVLFSLFRKERH